MKGRIYILPTRMGGYLNGLIFLMFLLSVGYSNNLLLIFTLFLFGLNLIWVVQTHFHLHALKLGTLQVEDQFAEELTLSHIHWLKTPEEPTKWRLTFLENRTKIKVGNNGELIFPHRGLWNLTHLKIESEMPFGLYRSWIKTPINVSVYIYPKRLKNVSDVLGEKNQIEGDNSTYKKGLFDIWNLGPYQGQESRKISWKHYARAGELVVKEGEDLRQEVVHFKINETDNLENELSIIATQMVHCQKNEIKFDLTTLNGKKVQGFKDSLRELAQC